MGRNQKPSTPTITLTIKSTTTTDGHLNVKIQEYENEMVDCGQVRLRWLEAESSFVIVSVVVDVIVSVIVFGFFEEGVKKPDSSNLFHQVEKKPSLSSLFAVK